ncbi:universal stress protein [Kribbella orskensis]|uniref:universal stress protein n=1 Tax=Kribbella TaxID=182639 RepID=UPI0034E1FDDF
MVRSERQASASHRRQVAGEVPAARHPRGDATGHPVAGLIAAAEETKAELLVLGGRTHRRLTAMLLGSTARGVLHHAPCPVAVVHEPRDGQ